MKASEFPQKHTPVKPTQVKQAVTEAAKSKTKKHAHPEHSVAPFGVDDADGHVMRRIRAAHPHLMTKLQNWD